MAHSIAPAKAVRVENQRCKDSKATQMVQISTVKDTLVNRTGFCLLLILGKRAMMKPVCAIEITMSCQRIMFLILAASGCFGSGGVVLWNYLII